MWWLGEVARPCYDGLAHGSLRITLPGFSRTLSALLLPVHWWQVLTDGFPPRDGLGPSAHQEGELGSEWAPYLSRYQKWVSPPRGGGWGAKSRSS